MTEFILVFKSLENRVSSTRNSVKIQSVQEFSSIQLALTHSGTLYHLSSDSSSIPKPLQCSTEICQISSNATSCLLLSLTGLVYSLGQDPEKTGILGHPGRDSQTPYLIQELSRIQQISLGRTHAGALSHSSAFYLWGNSASVSSCSPTRQTLELFTIQRFECGDNYSLITTTGGYLYIIGSIGFAHSSFKRQAPVGVFSPPNIDKMCVTYSAAGYSFVVFVDEHQEAFVFDGCLEIIKLPLKTGQKIESVCVVGDSIIGVCEDSYVVEWVLREGKEEDCNLYSFTGFSYKKCADFKVVGSRKNLFVLSEAEKPFGDKGEILMPYKRTEFGKKLINKVRDSVRISGKLDMIRSSLENSPVFKMEKNKDFSKCEKLVYAVNLVFKKFFSELKVFVYEKKTVNQFKNRGIFGLFYKNYEKYVHIRKARAFEKMSVYLEFRKFKTKCYETGIESLVETLNNLLMYRGLDGLIQNRKQTCFLRVLSTLEQKTFAKEKLFFRELKIHLRLWSLEKVIAPKLKLAFSTGFIPVQHQFKQVKCCTGLLKTIKKRVNRFLYSIFSSLKTYTWVIELNKKVFQLHQVTSIGSLIFLLNIWRTSELKSVFRILKHISLFEKLKNILNPRLHYTISSMMPKIISPTLLNLQRSFIVLIFRRQLEVIREIYLYSYLENSIEHEIDMLSPIKIFQSKETQEDSQIKCSSLTLPFTSNHKHKKSNSSELSDFQKYLLWYKEFKCRPKDKKKTEQKEARPPWRPSGNNIRKNKNEDEIAKKHADRRRDYSESIRSSRSSFSSEESFCRKIGWDKQAYFKKFRERKKRELTKLVSVNCLKRTVNLFIRRIWREIRKEISQRKANPLKNLVKGNWKIGFISIGLNKIAGLMKKKGIKIMLKKK